MVEKLLFKKKILNQLLLTEEEKEEIAKRIIEFMRECIRVKDYVSNDEHYGRYKSYNYIFKDWTFGESYWNRLTERKDYEISDSRLLDDFVGMGGMFDRFKYHIRMNASIPHIEKLIEILGEKVAIFYLEYFAKKNMAVAIILKEIIKNLKEEGSETDIKASEEGQ